MTLTPQQLTESILRLRELNEKRTKGEWASGLPIDENTAYVGIGCNNSATDAYNAGGIRPKDAAFIAYAPTAVEIIETLLGMMKEMRHNVAESRRFIDPIDDALADSFLHSSLECTAPLAELWKE